MKMRDARTLPSVAQEDLRRKVLRAIVKGEKQVEAAQLFGVTRQAVGKWVKKYREGGARLFEREREEGLLRVPFCPGRRLRLRRL